jgi:general secretion pathway protein D
MKYTKSVALVAILLQLLQTAALAQEEADKGTAPPAAGFGTNPFAPKPGVSGSDKFFEDDEAEEEEVEDISDEILRQRMEQRLRERAGNPGGSAPSAARPDTAPSTPSFGNSDSRGGGGGISNNRSRPSGGGQPAADFTEASSSVGNSIQPGANAQIVSNSGRACLKLDPDTGFGPDIIKNFDFPDADIVEIAKTLGRLTCLNFILDKDVRGKISVVSNSPITVGDAWKAFLTALDVNGFSIIPSGKYLRIARQRDAKDKQIKTYTGDFTPDVDTFITRVLPLKYISADELSRVFRNFMPPSTRIVAHEQTNTLFITDTGSNIKKIVDMITLLDVEGFDEGLEVIRIRFASAQDIAKLIDQLLPGNAAKSGAPGGAPGFRPGAGFTARKTKEGGVISHIIPDERTNAVIVSANGKGLEQVKQLIRKLDSKVSQNVGGSKIHVVYLQFADAEQVAQTLNNLASGGRSGPAPVIAGSAGGAPATAQLFEGAIKISADKATNSLVITGTPSDFGTINRVISKLDVPRDQVYVEAIIMEMRIGSGFQLGTSIANPASGIGFLPNGDFQNFLLNPLSVSGLVLGFKAGQKQSITIPGSSTPITVSSVQGLIKALQSNSNTNVLSTPQLLTLDNQEASIEVGETIPVPVTTALGNTGNTQQSFERQNVGLSLTIKPQINKISNFVKLDIKQKIEDVSNRTPPSGVATQAVGTDKRSSQTTVVVQDGDTVVLGGLVRDKLEENAVKVPLLGDIPLLGWLFRDKSKNAVKLNLISFITPKIIKQYSNMRQILDKKLRERDEYIEKNAGGEDVFEDQKMKMIKELPPVETLKANGRVENADVTPEFDDGEDMNDEYEEEEENLRARHRKRRYYDDPPAPAQNVQAPFVQPDPLAPGNLAPMAPPAASSANSFPTEGNHTNQVDPKPAPAPASPLNNGGTNF